jgi:hypothetical protein
VRAFLRFLRENKAYWVAPIVVFAIAIAIAVYVLTRPVLGTEIYRP